MKENETLGQKKLESINDEVFQSFDPDDASWVIGGKIPYTSTYTFDSGGSIDSCSDFLIE
jgi:hypothetical protein